MTEETKSSYMPFEETKSSYRPEETKSSTEGSSEWHTHARRRTTPERAKKAAPIAHTRRTQTHAHNTTHSPRTCPKPVLTREDIAGAHAARYAVENVGQVCR